MQAKASHSKHLLAGFVGLLPLIIFLALLLYVGVNAPNFMTFVNLKLVLMQSLPVVLSVIGLSAVVMAGAETRAHGVP